MSNKINNQCSKPSFGIRMNVFVKPTEINNFRASVEELKRNFPEKATFVKIKVPTISGDKLPKVSDVVLIGTTKEEGALIMTAGPRLTTLQFSESLQMPQGTRLKEIEELQ